MAINVQFNGATIYKPGAYSKTTIDIGGGFPVGPAGLIAVIGEADAGAPGSAEVDISNNRFTADQMPQIRSKYRSGAFVDAAGFLFAPAADAAIPSGAQTVWFYKTNESVRASLALSGSYGTMRALEWGIGGNRLTATITNTAEVAPVITGATIVAGAADAGTTFDLYMNGVKNVVTLAAGTYADTAAIIAAIAWPVGVTASEGLADNIVLTMAADAAAAIKGYAKSMEIAGAGAALVGLSAGLVQSSVEASSTIVLAQPRDLLTETESVGGNVVLNVGFNGVAATATIAIDDTKITLNAGTPIVFEKANYPTMKELVDDINIRTGWAASVSSTQYNQLSPEVLDQVSAIGALSPAGKPAMIKKDAAEVQWMFANSTLIELVDPVMCGLPSALTKTALAGGLKGGTSMASIVAALEKFTKFHVNFVLPLFSRDATADISDSLTDSTSAYTIDAIHQLVKSHISMMKTTKKRSERQGYLSLKKSFVDCKDQAGVLADGRQQLFIQDVRQVDAAGNIKWFQPWALAAMVAGARSGSSIGEPMTFKFMNVSGIRHTAQPMSTAEADIVIDFDPDTMTDEAIQAGITFLESRQGGGFRVVVDNTTYGRDGNFVWNRGNVIYAADIVAINLRNQLEDIYVGRKNTVKVAEIASTAASILETLRAQGVLVATPDAPTGFKDLSVRLEGNTIYVTVTIKIVEGIDFILSDITVQRATA
jgi:hypothetical protein